MSSGPFWLFSHPRYLMLLYPQYHKFTQRRKSKFMNIFYHNVFSGNLQTYKFHISTGQYLILEQHPRKLAAFLRLLHYLKYRKQASWNPRNPFAPWNPRKFPGIYFRPVMVINWKVWIIPINYHILTHWSAFRWFPTVLSTAKIGTNFSQGLSTVIYWLNTKNNLKIATFFTRPRVLLLNWSMRH